MLTTAHMTFGAVVIAANALAGGWGAFAWARGFPSVVFWYLLRIAQAAVVAQVAFGFALVATGSQPGGLHLLYGAAPIAVTLVTEGMRLSVATRDVPDAEDLRRLAPAEQQAIARLVVRRETGVMAAGAILILTLAARAYASGGG